MHTSLARTVHMQAQYILGTVKMEQGIQEEAARYALGEFGDARLKKQERNCMRGWSANRMFVCGNWEETALEKFDSVGFWPILA